MGPRFRNFLIQIVFSVFLAAVLIVFFQQYALAAILLVLNLFLAFLHDRRTVRTEKDMLAADQAKQLLNQKYPDIPVPDSEFSVHGKTVTLSDAFVKKALLDTLDYRDYIAQTPEDIRALECFYSAVTAGAYTLRCRVAEKKELIPGNDSADDYYVYCSGHRIRLSESTYRKCRIGDCFVEVSVRDLPGSSAFIWLDEAGQNHLVVEENKFHQLKARTH